MEIVLWGVFFGILILVGIILVRALRFKPDAIDVQEIVTDAIDEARVHESLSTMIQFKTIAHVDIDNIDQAPFEGFMDYLKKRYPLIHSQSEIITIEPSGIIYKIKGKSSSEPSVLMAHYDVVPENGVWERNPFSGDIEDGYIHGRGTLDTKITVCAIMESTEYCLQSGQTFANDLYLAFAGDEEVYGMSAQNMVKYFKGIHVTPKLVLDEGGAIVAGMIPGLKQKAAVIGIAEKGVLSLELTATSEGGHASMPPQETPMTKMARAIKRLNKRTTFKLRLTPSVQQMFDTITRYSTSFGIRVIFANLWLFLPIVKKLAIKSEGEMLALFKTTQAFTMMQGSEAINVLPSKVTLGINYRPLTGESTDEVIARVQKVMNDESISVKRLYTTEPSDVSLVDASYQKITDSIHETWQGICTTPYLVMAGTDARYYHDISKNVYRFSPLYMSKEDLKTIHGVNEKVSLENVRHCVQFYLNLLRKL